MARNAPSAPAPTGAAPAPSRAPAVAAPYVAEGAATPAYVNQDPQPIERRSGGVRLSPVQKSAMDDTAGLSDEGSAAD